MANITTAELAQEFGSSPRTVRKFLRSVTPREAQPGKGSRWSLPAGKREIATLRKAFDRWSAAEATARAERAARAAEEANEKLAAEVEEPTEA